MKGRGDLKEDAHAWWCARPKPSLHQRYVVPRIAQPIRVQGK